MSRCVGLDIQFLKLHDIDLRPLCEGIVAASFTSDRMSWTVLPSVQAANSMPLGSQDLRLNGVAKFSMLRVGLMELLVE